MVAQFEWKDEFNLGVERIDKEHQRLFKIINKLFSFQEEDKNGQWACQEGIKYFRTHTVKHFADEEAYMSEIHYSGLERHRQIHTNFRENTLPALERELERTDYAPDAVEHFLGVCAGWLIGHTMTEDLAITGKHAQRWEKLLPGEEINALRKAIIQTVFDLFHLESRLISDAYSGERFGNGIYYRLVYSTGQDEQWQEIIIAFEEKLLINTVGKMMGIQTNSLDSMLIHATRYTAQQFVQRIMEQFPAMEHYKLTEENLLTYEQLQELFKREQLQASLLFHTGGAGYFAYCVIAPHLLESGFGTAIQAGNALSEVERYLTDRKAQAAQKELSNKRKILLVDDSATIRQGMKSLLGEDYDVALADSGVAAIRAITLDRPDLVLMDYEMPVCDGRQTLEMLRADEELGDLPVIFLTGKRDPESMIKVMPLKPAGYLLKTSKPADLKKEIAAFFEKQKA